MLLGNYGAIVDQIVGDPVGPGNEPMLATNFSITLDTSGNGSIAVANADQMRLVSLVWDQPPSTLSTLYRTDPTNTTAIKVSAAGFDAADVGIRVTGAYRRA